MLYLQLKERKKKHNAGIQLALTAARSEYSQV